MLSLQVRSTIVATILFLVGSAVQASPINIDTFNDDPSLTGYPQHVGVFGLGFDESDMFGLDPANTLSGHRYAKVDTYDNPEGSYGSADLIVAGGKLGLGTNSVVSPYRAEWGVNWYGIGPSGGSLDLIDDDGTPNTGFLIDFLSAEYEYRLVLSVAQLGETRAPRAWTNEILLPVNPNPHTVFVPFLEFTNLERTTLFDWTEVYYAKVRIYGAEDGDYELDAIRVGVPEPATLFVLAAMGLAMLFRPTAKRKRAQQTKLAHQDSGSRSPSS